MKTVRVNKKELIVTVKRNLTNHQDQLANALTKRPESMREFFVEQINEIETDTLVQAVLFRNMVRRQGQTAIIKPSQTGWRVVSSKEVLH